MIFDHAVATGVDIGRNSIKIAVVKIHGEVIAAISYPLNSYQTRDYLISMLHRTIKDIRQSVASQGVNPICIGTADKGSIDYLFIIGNDCIRNNESQFGIGDCQCAG